MFGPSFNSADCLVAWCIPKKIKDGWLVVQVCCYDWFLAFVALHINPPIWRNVLQLASWCVEILMPKWPGSKTPTATGIPSIDTSYISPSDKPFTACWITRDGRNLRDPSDTDRHLDFGGNKLAEPSGNLSSLAFVWTRAVTVCLYCRCLCVYSTSRHPTLRDWTCLSVLLGKWYYRMVSIVVASTSMKGRELPLQLRYPTMSGSFPLGAVGACARIYHGKFQVHVGHTNNWYILTNLYISCQMPGEKPRITKKIYANFQFDSKWSPWCFFLPHLRTPNLLPQTSISSVTAQSGAWMSGRWWPLPPKGNAGNPHLFYKDLTPLITHSSEVQGKIEALGCFSFYDL